MSLVQHVHENRKKNIQQQFSLCLIPSSSMHCIVFSFFLSYFLQNSHRYVMWENLLKYICLCFVVFSSLLLNLDWNTFICLWLWLSLSICIKLTYLLLKHILSLSIEWIENKKNKKFLFSFAKNFFSTLHQQSIQ